MIVLTENSMVNPKHVGVVEIGQEAYGGYTVRLIRDGERGAYCFASKYFKNEAEAELFMDYCCKEIDMANGVYKESNEESEENIC